MNISIIIININGFKFLDQCIKSILNSKIKNEIDFEIIIFDNNSNINQIKNYKKIKLLDKRIKIIYSKVNIGPAKGRNIASFEAKYPLLCYLDNDTEVDKFFFKNPIKLYKKNKKLGIVQCKLLKMNTNKFDYAGDYISNYGLLKKLARDNECDRNQYKTKTKILSAKSAGMFISKKAFIDVGGFDDSFFIYVEETDIGWRTWLMGYENIFCNESIVYHHGSSTQKILSNKKIYLNYFFGPKNYLSTFYKNLELKNFKLFFSVLFLWQALSIFYFLTLKLNRFYYINLGIFSFFFNLKIINKKRSQIQKKRKINDKKLFKSVLKRINFISLVRSAFKT